MEHKELHISISPRAGSFTDDVYIYSDAPNNQIAVMGIKDCEVYTTLYERGRTDIPPTFTADSRAVRMIAQAFVDNAKKLGATEPTKEYAAGKLEATELHLADMRRIAFEKAE